MILIAGLGNPGVQYHNTRHNIGFMAVDLLVSRFNAHPVHKEAFKGELYKKDSILLLKPLTYMNLSGESIQKVHHFYKTEELIVIHDDLDLPFGGLRFKRGGSHGGHNGLKSIDMHMGTEYVRIRAGIGRPVYKSQVTDYVLNPFNEKEIEHMEGFVDKIAKASWALTKEPLETVKAHFSQKKIDIHTHHVQ